MSGDIGALTGKLFHLKQQKKALNDELKELNKEIFNVERQLLEEMSLQDLWEAGNQDMRVYRGTKTVPKVVNWDQFLNYVYENKAGHLLERRPSVTACREMFEGLLDIPGVDPHTFEEVRTRSK